jgi:hypothetical protein
MRGGKYILAIALIVAALIPATSPTWAKGWVTLGCRDVNFNVDRDVVRVARNGERFTAIRLRVTGNDIRMLDLKVVYGNGKPDDIPVQAVIRAGSQSGPLDLHGRDRGIDRIQMIYKSRPNFNGRARVCVDGRTP